MSKLADLRTIGAVPGGVVDVLEEFDARLKALEGHSEMLAYMQPDFDATKAQADAVKAQADAKKAADRAAEAKKPKP